MHRLPAILSVRPLPPRKAFVAGPVLAHRRLADAFTNVSIRADCGHLAA